MNKKSRSALTRSVMADLREAEATDQSSYLIQVRTDMQSLVLNGSELLSTLMEVSVRHILRRVPDSGDGLMDAGSKKDKKQKTTML